MKTFDFMQLIRRSRHMGTPAEERAYYHDKFTIEIFEGRLRNYKLVQQPGRIMITNG